MQCYLQDETHDELSDEDILARATSDPECFALIITRYEAAFTRKVRVLLWNEEDVVDVVQEAFTKIYLAAHKYHSMEGARFQSWAYTILMNTAYTKYQKRKKERGVFTQMLPEEYEALADTVHESSFHLEWNDYVVSVLAKMPEQLSRVLELHFLRDVPQQTIAENEGVSVGAIKTRVHRAKAQFRLVAQEYSPF